MCSGQHNLRMDYARNLTTDELVMALLRRYGVTHEEMESDSDTIKMIDSVTAYAKTVVGIYKDQRKKVSHESE